MRRVGRILRGVIMMSLGRTPEKKNEHTTEMRHGS